MFSGTIQAQSRETPAPAPTPKRRPFEWGSLIIGTFLIAALATGWIWREALPYTAEIGVGYWLGITGLSCVGVLLLYPLRKRAAFLGVFGSVPAWFRLHMFMGALAPVLILYHSKFAVGSINAMVALVSMLIVAGSGVIGRFLYIRIYRGVAGKKEEARRLLQEASAFRELLNANFAEAADIAEDLETALKHSKRGLIVASWRAIRDSSLISSAQSRMISAVRTGAKQQRIKNSQRRELRKRSIELIKRYCESLRAAAQLEVFERLFALWHVVHLPLFFLMLFAAVIHVFAVHLY
jgi:Skp family chaperone for outer membrane proteins